MMKWLIPLLGLVVLTIAIWGLTEAQEVTLTKAQEATPTKAQEARPHFRAVAFDNTYRNATRLRIYFKVDDAAEKSETATCDRRTCTFLLQLTNARHVVELSVEQNGKRSAPTKVSLDTTAMK